MASYTHRAKRQQLTRHMNMVSKTYSMSMRQNHRVNLPQAFRRPVLLRAGQKRLPALLGQNDIEMIRLSREVEEEAGVVRFVESLGRWRGRGEVEK